MALGPASIEAAPHSLDRSRSSVGPGRESHRPRAIWVRLGAARCRVEIAEHRPPTRQLNGSPQLMRNSLANVVVSMLDGSYVHALSNRC